MTQQTSSFAVRIEPGLAGLSEEQLEVARLEATKQRISLRESILRLGIVTEAQLLTAVSERTGRPFLAVSPEDIRPEALAAVTANIASHYTIIPLEITWSRGRPSWSRPP